MEGLCSWLKLLTVGAILFALNALRRWIDDELKELTNDCMHIGDEAYAVRGKNVKDLTDEQRYSIFKLSTLKQLTLIMINDAWIPFDPTGHITTFMAGQYEEGFVVSKVKEPVPMMFVVSGFLRILNNKKFEKYGKGYQKGELKSVYYLKRYSPFIGAPFKVYRGIMNDVIAAQSLSRELGIPVSTEKLYGANEFKMALEKIQRSGMKTIARQIAIDEYVDDNMNYEHLVRKTIEVMADTQSPYWDQVSVKSEAKAERLRWEYEMEEGGTTLPPERIKWYSDCIYYVMNNMDQIIDDQGWEEYDREEIINRFTEVMNDMIREEVQLQYDRIEKGPPQ